MGVYLGWFGRATRLVHYASALAAPMERVPGVRTALDAQVRRIQRTRAQPSAAQRLQSEVVAVAGDASGTELATVRLTGGELGPAEAFGLADLEHACATAGFHRVPAQ